MKRLRALIASGAIAASTLLIAPGSVSAGLTQSSSGCAGYTTTTNFVCFMENANLGGDERLLQVNNGGVLNLYGFVVNTGDYICAGQFGWAGDWDDCISSLKWKLVDSSHILCVYQNANYSGIVIWGLHGPSASSYSFTSGANDTATSFRLTTATTC